MKSMKKLVLASLALLAVMMVILPLVGCDTNAGSSSTLNTGTTGGNTGDNGNGSDNSGNNGSDSSSGNAGGETIVFKTAPGYLFPLTFTFKTKEGTVVVAHPIDGNKYGTYTGNLNQDGTITMIVNDDSGQTRGITTIIGIISESGKKLTAELPEIGETVLIREDASDSGNDGNTGIHEPSSQIPEGFVYIPAGNFQMGSNQGYDNNKPVHEVKISKGFLMGKYEVTVKEYLDVMGKWDFYSSSQGGNNPNDPIVSISWFHALVYCNKLSIKEGYTPCYKIKGSTNPSDWGDIEDVPYESYYNVDEAWYEVTCDWTANGYRLPTEAEWEYAARAGNNTTDALIWSGTANEWELRDYACYYGYSDNGSPYEVGEKKPNAYGLYDMSGNVEELCWDYAIYTESMEVDPRDRDSDVCCYRGGAYFDSAEEVSVQTRAVIGLTRPSSEIGFRVVRSAE